MIYLLLPALVSHRRPVRSEWWHLLHLRCTTQTLEFDLPAGVSMVFSHCTSRLAQAATYSTICIANQYRCCQWNSNRPSRSNIISFITILPCNAASLDSEHWTSHVYIGVGWIKESR